MNDRNGRWEKSQLSVHIVTSDSHRILERLAAEIASRVPYVTYGREPDPTASVQYYITYGCRHTRISPIEVALFTHREEEASAAALFDAAAREVDFAVAMSGATLKLVNALGVREASCIMPGVDIEAFRPKLKIAVVGRTYYTGREGEMLVRAVMDVPDIEWHFTAEGWPGVAEHVADSDLPAFYRSMDYILVPALNEGGPMSVLEALASGVEVIASDVGWVADFPHIPFERGDAVSLRNVLLKLRDKRMQLRSSVEHMTWDQWASDHDSLFRALFERMAPRSLATSARPTPGLVYSVELVTHGLEDRTLGGPSRRVPGTARALRSLSVTATVSYDRIMPSADIVHGFNIWKPKTALRVAREAKRLDKPLVFSPIMLDLSEAPLWQEDLFRAFRSARSGNEAEAMIRHYVQVHRERMALHPPVDPEPGYKDMVTEIAELADALIYLSDHERIVFDNLVGDVGTPGYLVRNPVDATHFQHADRELFRQTYGVQDYVVSVARVEPRKNQLMLVNALRDSGLPIILVGHETHFEYADLIRRFGGPNVVMIDRMEPDSNMLRSVIAGARVFVLPSWVEGAPLTALEAAATGANMVLSNRSGEREYLGDRARYCDPADPDSIRQSVLEAWDTPLTPAQARDLAGHVKDKFSWESHALQTRSVYDDVLKRSSERPAKCENSSVPLVSSGGDIILDVTTWANNADVRTGVVRSERSVGAELIKRTDISVRIVIYHSLEVGFIEIPQDVILQDVLSSFVVLLKSKKVIKQQKLRFPAGSNILVVGGSWMLDPSYAAGLVNFARSNGSILSVFMHDMAPTLFPLWYDVGYSETWHQNCATVIAHTNRLIVYSESTRNDVVAFAEKYKIVMPVVSKIRLADGLGALGSKPTAAGLGAREFFRSRPFVLSVGGIHPRKNYGLLYDVWLILRERMGDACPHLVIVGGEASNGAETARVMRNDSKVESHIHILENVDDSSLDWFYGEALMTAYPSFYEGWGLPVGESLAHGKICLSSSSSAMKEVAPELTELIDPFDRIRWASMIQHYATSFSSRTSREREIRNNFKITSWAQTADDVVRVLASEMTVRPSAIYNLGDIAFAGNHGEGTAYLQLGWYGSEAWGRWAKSGLGAIELRFAHLPDEDVILTVLAKVLKPKQVGVWYEVRANRQVVALWEFPPVSSGEVGAQILINRAVIPREIAGASDCLRIEIAGDRTFAVHEVFPDSKDLRRLGIGLSAFMVEGRSRAGDPAVLFSTREDIRAALQAGPSVDLPNELTQTIHRPSILPDKRIHDFRPYCRIGLPNGEDGIHAQDNCLSLAFGVARLRFDRPVRMQCVIDASYACPAHSVTLALFINNHCVRTIHLSDDTPMMVDVDIPPSLLIESDPLNVSVFEAGAKQAGTPDLFITMMNFSQDMVLPSQKWPKIALGQSLRPGSNPDRQQLPEHMLVDGWHNLEGVGIWSLAQLGRLRFAIDPDQADDCFLLLELSRISSEQDGEDRIAIIAENGAMVVNAQMVGGNALQHQIFIPLKKAADSRGHVDIRLVPSRPTWPSRNEVQADYRRLGVQLLAFELKVFANADGEMLMLKGWHEPEPHGCWSAETEATFVFRTKEVGQIPIIHADLLPGYYQEHPGLCLRYSVNDAAPVEVQIHPEEDPCISLHLPAVDRPGFHHVSFSGIEPVSPISLGINDDLRPLGIRLLSLSFISATETVDDGSESVLAKPEEAP